MFCTWTARSESHLYPRGFAMIDTDLGIGDVLGSSLELGTLSHCHLISKWKYSVYDLHLDVLSVRHWPALHPERAISICFHRI